MLSDQVLKHRKNNNIKQTIILLAS